MKTNIGKEWRGTEPPTSISLCPVSWTNFWLTEDLIPSTSPASQMQKKKNLQNSIKPLKVTQAYSGIENSDSEKQRIQKKVHFFVKNTCLKSNKFKEVIILQEQSPLLT